MGTKNSQGLSYGDKVDLNQELTFLADLHNDDITWTVSNTSTNTDYTDILDATNKYLGDASITVTNGVEDTIYVESEPKPRQVVTSKGIIRTKDNLTGDDDYVFTSKRYVYMDEHGMTPVFNNFQEAMVQFMKLQEKMIESTGIAEWQIVKIKEIADSQHYNIVFTTYGHEFTMAPPQYTQPMSTPNIVFSNDSSTTNLAFNGNSTFTVQSGD